MKRLALILCLVLAGCAYVPTHEAPRTPMWATLRTAGSSMGGDNGHTVRADFGFPYDQLQAGDTVLFWSPGRRRYIHHRLVRRVPIVGAWITQGDANSSADTHLLTRRDYLAKTTILEVRR